MKQILFVLFCVTLFFAACKEPANPPTAVLDGMFTAMKNGNLVDMKKFITKQDVAMLETAEKFMTRIDPEGIEKLKTRMMEELKENAKNISYTLKNEKIDGDKATVEAEIISKDATGKISDKPGKHTFELVKEDNAWKIALTQPGNEMFNSMKGNMGNKKGDIKDGLEKLQKMNPDSLKMLINKGLQAMDSLNRKKKE